MERKSLKMRFDFLRETLSTTTSKSQIQNAIHDAEKVFNGFLRARNYEDDLGIIDAMHNHCYPADDCPQDYELFVERFGDAVNCMFDNYTLRVTDCFIKNCRGAFEIHVEMAGTEDRKKNIFIAKILKNACAKHLKLETCGDYIASLSFDVKLIDANEFVSNVRYINRERIDIANAMINLLEDYCNMENASVKDLYMAKCCFAEISNILLCETVISNDIGRLSECIYPRYVCRANGVIAPVIKNEYGEKVYYFIHKGYDLFKKERIIEIESYLDNAFADCSECSEDMMSKMHDFYVNEEGTFAEFHFDFETAKDFVMDHAFRLVENEFLDHAEFDFDEEKKMFNIHATNDFLRYLSVLLKRNHMYLYRMESAFNSPNHKCGQKQTIKSITVIVDVDGEEINF